MPDPAAPLLRITGLRHAYGAAPVLAGIDLDLAGGELLAILGASGCGKTTILRAVAGLVEPLAGRIELGGEVLTDVAQRRQVPVERRGVGVVFQDYALFPGLDVRGNVAFGLSRADQGRADELLDLIGLRELGRRRIAELSGGQQQRVALARALAPRPRLLLLDEPFANLDATLREDLALELRATLHQAGQAALLVTHDRHEALGLADRVAILVAGPAGAVIGQVADPATIYRRPASAEVARLTGPVGIFAGEAEGAVARTPLGTLPLAEAHQGTVTVLARPDDLSFTVGEGPVTVRSRRFLGHATRIACTTPTGDCIVDLPAGTPIPDEGGRGSIAATTPLWAIPR